MSLLSLMEECLYNQPHPLLPHSQYTPVTPSATSRITRYIGLHFFRSARLHSSAQLVNPKLFCFPWCPCCKFILSELMQKFANSFMQTLYQTHHMRETGYAKIVSKNIISQTIMSIDIMINWLRWIRCCAQKRMSYTKVLIIDFPLLSFSHVILL